MGTDTEDGYLVRRAQEGYLDAYAELVDRHGRLAYRVALRLLGNHDDAEDVAQEALVSAWQQLPGFQGKSSYATWLYQIVTRRALNRITRTPTDESLELMGDVALAAEEPPRRRTRPHGRRRHRCRRGPAAAAASRYSAAPLRGPAQPGGCPHNRQHRPGRS